MYKNPERTSSDTSCEVRVELFEIIAGGICKNGAGEPICRPRIETEMQRTHLWTREREAGTTWETTLIYSRAYNRRLAGAADAEASARCSVMTRGVGRRGGEGGRLQREEGAQACIRLSHFIVLQKPTRHCKANIFQFF